MAGAEHPTTGFDYPLTSIEMIGGMTEKSRLGLANPGISSTSASRSQGGEENQMLTLVGEAALAGPRQRYQPMSEDSDSVAPWHH